MILARNVQFQHRIRLYQKTIVCEESFHQDFDLKNDIYNIGLIGY